MMKALIEDRVLRHHLRMTAAGFLVGCSIAVPTAILLNGWIYVREAMLKPSASPTAIKAVQNNDETRAAPGSRPETTRSSASASQSDFVRKALDDRLQTARALLSRGQVERVREMLAGDSTTPDAAFLLAATFDPNVLASLNLTNIRAEVARARKLYTQALVGGISTARQRLDALQ